MTKKARLRLVKIVGVLVVALILGRTIQVIGFDAMLTPYGFFMFLMFALAVGVMCADFFIGGEKSN
jgi:purine-cytosine permease-like protein